MTNYNLVDLALQLGGKYAKQTPDYKLEGFLDMLSKRERMAREAGKVRNSSAAYLQIVDVKPLSAVAASCGGTREGPSARNADGGGLSTNHISPQVIYNQGASLMKCSRGIKSGKVNTEIKKRGKVKAFTSSSRRRLLRTLAQTKRELRPLFVTLTYPGVWPEQPREWKRHLDNFIKRLARAFPAAAGVWKLEPQKRGAPHFHLLVWGVDYLSLRAWVPENWYEIVGSGDERHLRAGTRVEVIHSHEGVMWYASKYLGKEVQALWGDVGRWWGVFARAKMPFGEVVMVDVTHEQAMTIIRYMRRFARIRSRDYKSLTVICNADFWAVRLL